MRSVIPSHPFESIYVVGFVQVWVVWEDRLVGHGKISAKNVSAVNIAPLLLHVRSVLYSGRLARGSPWDTNGSRRLRVTPSIAARYYLMTASTPVDVIIIGAGAAGLAAAERLRSVGVACRLLERQPRVGGRAWNGNADRPGSFPGQLGPVRFLSHYQRVRTYVERYALATDPMYPRQKPIAARKNGRRLATYWPGPDEMWGHPGRPEPTVKQLARKLLGRPEGTTFTIRGGTERLTDALAAPLTNCITTGVAVSAIDSHADHVSISYSDEHHEGIVRARFAICAIPLSELDKIAWYPQLPKSCADVAQRIPFASAVRIFLRCRTPVWAIAGESGFAVSEEVGEIWPQSTGDSEAHHWLICYAQGSIAQRLEPLSNSDRVAIATNEIEQLWPGASRQIDSGWSFSWKSQNWIAGGWPLVRDGFIGETDVFLNPHGSVYFAGDYVTSPDLLNTVEGAIQSGHRAADAVHSALSPARRN